MQDQSEGGDFFAAYRKLVFGDDTLTTLKQNKLPPAKPVPAIPERTGSSAPIPLSGSGGIASPLTEASYAERVYFPAKNLVTSDGLFTMSVQHLQQISMRDANDATVIMIFKDKP